MEDLNYDDSKNLMEFVEEKIDTEVLYEQDTNEFDKFCIKELEIEAAQSEVNRQFDLQLIKSIRNYENLYANNRKESKEVIERDWEKVAEECNTTVEKVKYRWKLLRGYFSAEKKKRKLEMKINAQNLFTRQQFSLYEDMLFLDKYVKSRRSFKVCQSHITFEHNEVEPLISEEDSQNQANNDNASNSNSEEFALINDESEDNSYMDEFLLNDVLNPELIDLDNLLINHVRKYRYLYDKTNRFEQRSDLHDHTWAKIAKACGVTEKYAKERWCRLRAYYVRARKKRGCSNGGINGKNTFFFFDSMQFLDEHIQYRRNYSSKKITGKKSVPVNDDSSENYEIWSRNVLKLDKMIIDAVKGYPNLYDRSHSSYGNSLVANNSWAAVSAQCGETEEFVKTRWARLRGYFAKEMRKVDSRHVSSTKMPKRNFPFWDDMKFLKKHIKKRKVFYTTTPNDKNSPKKNGNKIAPERKKLNDTSNKNIRIEEAHQSIDTPVEQFRIFQHHPTKREEDMEFESNMETDNNSEQSELENEDADLDLLLIELVRRNPHLYNKRKKTPEEMIKINSTWSEIAKKCDVEENYAKCRWQTLRKYYSSENRRMKLNGYNQPRKFPFFELMNFLDGYVELRRNFKTEVMPVTQKVETQLTKEEQENLDRNLIEYISNYPNIWKQKKGNKDLVPESIWSEIGEKCGITADVAKNRWEYLKKHANDIDAEPNFMTSQIQKPFGINFFNETKTKAEVSPMEIENSESTQDSCRDRNNFNIDSDLLLIRTIREHSVLYVCKKNVVEKSKDDAWNEVAKECNITVEYAKSRWCRLRSYYTSWKKRKELIANKQNHTMEKRNFPFWEDMKFLDKYIKKRNRKGLFEKKISVKREVDVADDQVDLPDIKVSPQETCFDSILVDLVEKYKYLYDYTHLYYGNAHKTKEAWTKIGQICSLTPDEAKSRWRLIRKYYVKSKKRASSCPNAESSDKKRHLAKLSFLDKFIRHRSFFGRKLQKTETSGKNSEAVEAYSEAYYEEESRERDENDRFLIKCVEQHSTLYNRKDPAFANERCKQEAWQSIAKLCNKTAQECLKRWTLLRRYFTYEKRKLENRNQDDANLPQRNFPFYEDMLFLNPFILPRKNLKKLILHNMEEGEEEEEEDEENFEEITNMVTDTNVSVESSQNENSQQSEEAIMSTGNNPESDIQIIFIYNNKDEQFSPLEITKINRSSENLSEFLMLSPDSN